MEQSAQEVDVMSEGVLRYYVDFESRLSAVNDKLMSISSNYTKSLEEKSILFEKLELILENLPAGIIVIDNNGLVTRNNKQAHDIFETNLTGKYWSHIVNNNCLGFDESEVRLVNGRRVTITTMPLQCAAEQIIMINDVTADSNVRNENNKRTKARALEKLALSVAHQIKTPLSTALLSISQAINSDNIENVKRNLSKTLSKIQDISSLTDELLGVSQSKNVEKKKIKVSELYQFLEDYVDVLERKYSIPVKLLNKDIDDVYIKANKSSLTSSILNLIENAMQATSDKNTVKVEFIVDGDYLNVNVIDQGVGVSSSIGLDMFSPFVSTKKVGNGLGLSISKSIVDSHQGEINYYNNKGLGATFTIKLKVFDE